MSDRLFPQTTFQKVFCVTLLLGSYSASADLAAQASSQKTLEQRMQTIFFATGITRGCNEHVATDQHRQETCAIHPFEQCGTGIEFDVVKQRDLQQQLLNRFRLVSEDFFSEVVE